MTLRSILCFILMMSIAVAAFAEQQSLAMKPLIKQVEGCGCLIYSSPETTKEKLIFMTNDLGDAATLGWINLGHGDIELASTAYLEDDKSMIFEFKGNGITLTFTGTIIEPATEEREYHILKGELLLTPMNGISAFRRLFSCKKNKKIICKALKVGSQSKTIPVYAHNGC